MSRFVRSRLLRFGLGLAAVLVVPLVLSTLVFPPHNGRISYTRLELFVVMVLLTAVVTATVGGVRSAVQLVFGRLRSTRASPTTPTRAGAPSRGV